MLHLVNDLSSVLTERVMRSALDAKDDAILCITKFVITDNGGVSVRSPLFMPNWTNVDSLLPFVVWQLTLLPYCVIETKFVPCLLISNVWCTFVMKILHAYQVLNTYFFRAHVAPSINDGYSFQLEVTLEIMFMHCEACLIYTVAFIRCDRRWHCIHCISFFFATGYFILMK